MLSGLSIVISTCLIIVESGKIPDTLRDEIQAHKGNIFILYSSDSLTVTLFYVFKSQVKGYGIA